MKWQCYLVVAACAWIAAYEYDRTTRSNVVDALKSGRLSVDLSKLISIALSPSLESLKILGAYFGLLYVLSFITPGYAFQGPPLRDGRKLTFYINGLPILFTTLLVYGGMCYQSYIPWTLPYDHYIGFLIWTHVIAFLTSLYLFIRGRLKGLASGKGIWEDFVMGQELVPIVAGVKLNFFWLRPSMMGWLFLNIGFLAKHWQVNGRVSDAMVLYQCFTNAYILDYFYFEEFVTSTWDIIAEKFGFMLVWGDLCFIPFAFTLQGWFLVHDQTQFTLVEWAGLVLLFSIGYIIFRFANKQKHDFKKNPKGLVWGKKPEVIGGRLLVSGWWGLASHINYLGDLVLAVSYAAPCGLFRTGSFIPWFYPFYLFVLLIHRDWRDDEKCRQKYGKLWVEYRKRVPYRMVPYIY